MEVICSLVSIYFDNPQLDDKNKLYKTLRLLIQRYAQF